MFSPKSALTHFRAKIASSLMLGLDKVMRSQAKFANLAMRLAVHEKIAGTQTPGAFGRYVKRERPAGSKMARRAARGLRIRGY